MLCFTKNIEKTGFEGILESTRSFITSGTGSFENRARTPRMDKDRMESTSFGGLSTQTTQRRCDSEDGNTLERMRMFYCTERTGTHHPPALGRAGALLCADVTSWPSSWYTGGFSLRSLVLSGSPTSESSCFRGAGFQASTCARHAWPCPAP